MSTHVRDPQSGSNGAVTWHPGRLWSLWDIMNRFRAATMGAVFGQLSRAATMIEMMGAVGMTEDHIADRSVIREALEGVDTSLAELPLSRVIRSQFERLTQSVAVAGGPELAILVRELCNNLEVELSSAWFLMIPADRREYYQQSRAAFGEEVQQNFTEASSDIAAASRCFALDEWTACVFHLMRVLEHGLRKLATTVGLPPEAMQHENWKNIIDQVEKKIREMEELPKTPEKIARIQILSEAAIQFRYFKDAWRNHVSHAHATYDNHAGPMVWIHVRAFMQSMASPALTLP